MSVCEIIRRLMSEGEVSIGRAALASGISKRTLQRHLARSGLDYSALVDEMRLAHAVALISNPALRIVDVARALGYSDAANFVRAFKRWTGLSPTRFKHLEPVQKIAVVGAGLKPKSPPPASS